MADRCIWIDDALVRVSPSFDATEGSADMVAMREVLAAARAKFADEPVVEAHPFQPEDGRERRCAVCGKSRLAYWHRGPEQGRG